MPFAALSSAWQWLAGLPHLSAWLTAAYVAYLAYLLVWIVLQKREPAATLSWILSLAALPYLGLFIYWLLGPQRIKRQRLRRGRSRAGLEQYGAMCPVDADCSELALLAQASTGLAPSSATRADLLVDGAATYAALLEAIAAATDHVHLEYYIFEPDTTGTRVRDALVERARAGVAVRVLLDAVGSSRVRRAFLEPLRQAGGEVLWFHPAQVLKPFRRPWVNLRTHRKIAIVDGRIAFTGGINVTDTENEALRADAYRDLHLRVEGHVVRSLQMVFVEDWLYAGRQATSSLDVHRLWPRDMPARRDGGIHAQVVVSGPDSALEAIHRLHVAAIHGARERVWLATPYFVPGEAARMALTSAALAGLDVRLLVPRVSDSRFVTWAARSYFDELLAAGVRVFEYGPRMLHSKALLVDAELCLFGSANFDHRSFRLNFEVSMLFRDRAMAAALEAVLAGDLAQAREVTAPRGGSLWRQRLPEAMARLASPLL
ncbi:cardiolipin synthase [Xanthomonas massiliensis]|uniref:cardiolipin synthase n=1 Tax=Xanthomonas massiliensis TaxID=1720302 RepID=UPI000825D469|nr:cardiolipin synthase [Xanthomonas massiliensis]